MNEKPERSESESPQIMTIQDTADYLGLHMITIYRLLKKREIPGVKIGGQWRFKRDVLESWLDRRMNHS